MLAPTSGAVMLVHSNPVDPCVQDYGVEIFHALLSVILRIGSDRGSRIPSHDGDNLP
ncbi:hypothetical protein CK203_044428 [Vitis vinifera]|uniref:Uncharacterized protein n=1 Tax=Vitis vinifera TaxID=29760 RepID=A0A438HUD9_VITVI|nr:hypothetical protein CK203_044428 [Vitis vinifera]